MKYSDDLFDANHDIKLSCVFGILCAVASAMASVYSIDAAYIFISVLIGCLLAIKIDVIHHVITLIVFLTIVLLCGIPDLSWVILLICILAALGDEVGHELISNVTDNRFLNLFFEYRFVMKVVILILAVCGVFNIWIFLCFILFEISYELAGILFKSLN